MSKATGFIKEFRDFAVKGNAIDLAVGVIIGAAFGKDCRLAGQGCGDAPVNFILGLGRFLQQIPGAIDARRHTLGPMTYAGLTKAGAPTSWLAATFIPSSSTSSCWRS